MGKAQHAHRLWGTMPMRYPAPGNERGSILVFTIFTVVAGVTLLLVAANVGNIWARKGATQDAAEMLAPLLLTNQMICPPPHTGCSNTEAFANTLQGASEADLAHSVGAGGEVQYVFGNADDDGTDFSPIDDTDPPAIDSTGNVVFNAIKVEVRTTPADLGDLFLHFGLDIATVRGQAIAVRPSEPEDEQKDCLCNAYCDAINYWLGKEVCLLLCTLGDLLGSLHDILVAVLHLNILDIFDALHCVFQDLKDIVVVTVSTAVDLVGGVIIIITN